MKGRVPSRGAASLLVVMVLFFIMMIAVALNSRSLVFEQKTSANQYRYTQAFEAGEAGLQWALTMLNSGRVDASCNASADPSHNTFRERYLSVDVATGQFTPLANLSAACVLNDGAWTCSCPTTGNPVLTQPTGDVNSPMFVVRLTQAAQPGMVRVQASACSNFGTQCTNAASERSDAFAQVDSLLSLAGGLRTQPGAALTAKYRVAFSGTQFRVANTDEETSGITVNAGMDISGTPQLISTPGSLDGNSLVQHDSSLYNLSDRFFASYFGASPAMFRQLTMVRTITCSADCSSAIQEQFDRGYRAFWIEGDMSLGGTATLGTAADPVLLAVRGNVELGESTVHGVVYSGADTWNNGNGSGLLQGAALANGNFQGGGTPNFVYDPHVLARLQLRTGTFARVPGSWSDSR